MLPRCSPCCDGERRLRQDRVAVMTYGLMYPEAVAVDIVVAQDVDLGPVEFASEGQASAGVMGPAGRTWPACT